MAVIPGKDSSAREKRIHLSLVLLIVSLLLVAPVSAAPVTLPADPVGSILNLLQVLAGMVDWPVAVPVAEGTVSVAETPTASPSQEEQVAGFTIDVSSIPPGGRVFVDGRATGKTTPCTVEIRNGTNAMIQISRQGYLPFEQQVNGPGAIQAVLTGIPGTPAPNGTPVPTVVATPVPAATGSHHGGMYIRSYPDTVDISIDGILVGSKAPVIVDPLKAGTYTVSAAIKDSTNAPMSRASREVTVEPGLMTPVSINLMSTMGPATVTVSSTSRNGSMFTVNGLGPLRTIGDQVELVEEPSFITLISGSSFLSFGISESDRASGRFAVPDTNPPVCNLEVSTRPSGGEIFLDGIRTGLRTPAVIPNVSSGYHRIWILAEGATPVDELIQIPDSACREGSFKVVSLLEAYPSGDLRALSDPPGAAIAVRGLDTGEVTPYTFEDVPLGIWEVRFTDRDGRVKSIDVTLNPGGTKSCSVVFT